MTMTLVSTVTVPSDQTNITFSSIPQTGTDLIAYVSGQINDAGGPFGFSLQYNGAGYSSAKALNGDGSTATSVSNGNFSWPGTNYSSFSNSVHYIPNYTTATAHSVSIDHVMENNGTASQQRLIAVLTTSTAAITSLGFNSAAIKAGTVISLYTITKGSGGATVS